jgi:hypothetical protein
MSKSLVPSIAMTALLAMAGGAAQAAALKVTAEVDTEFCASGAVQCSLAGHGFAAATDLNHNPVRLFVHVARASSGVNLGALALANFTFNNGFVPAGGGSAVICSQANCGASRFGGGVGGAYSIILDRAAAGNWKAGAYAGTITINNGADTGTALVTFRIPDAGAASALMPAQGVSADGLDLAR